MLSFYSRSAAPGADILSEKRGDRFKKPSFTMTKRSERTRDRYHTDEAYRARSLSYSYALQLRAGLIVRPSARLVKKYGLEALVEELGLRPVDRSADEKDARRPAPMLTLDAWKSTPRGPLVPRENQAAP